MRRVIDSCFTALGRRNVDGLGSSETPKWDWLGVFLMKGQSVPGCTCSIILLPLSGEGTLPERM